MQIQEKEINIMLENGYTPTPGIIYSNSLSHHKNYINRIKWSPVGTKIGSSDITGKICLVNPDKSNNDIKNFNLGNQADFCWAPDGNRIAACTENSLIVYGANYRNTIWKKNLKYQDGVSWSPKGNYIATGSINGIVRLWNAEDGNILKEFADHRGDVYEFAWSSDEKYLASGGGSGRSKDSDHSIRIWDIENQKYKCRLDGHTGFIAELAWSTNNNLLASASKDKTIRIWDPIRDKLLTIVESHTDEVRGLSFSPDEKILVSHSWDNTLRFWHSTTLALLTEVNLPNIMNQSYNRVAFEPKCNRLAIVRGEIIHVWKIDIETIIQNTPKNSVNYISARIALVGDPGVGKTKLGMKISQEQQKKHFGPQSQKFWTIPSLNLKRDDGTECEAILWDIADLHVQRQVNPIFLENIDAALIVIDPIHKKDPLEGVSFWLDKLKINGQNPPTILVGGRVDMGDHSKTQKEIDEFCQKNNISGGYVKTSERTGQGIDTLINKLKNQIKWNEMTEIVTTISLKCIKDFILEIKESDVQKNILLSFEELKKRLEKSNCDFSFSESEIKTVVENLTTQGYITSVRHSSGKQYILLQPFILFRLATSICDLADKNFRGLGSIVEKDLMNGKFVFDELKNLSHNDKLVLIDAAILRLINHKICFRESHRKENLIIFPELIKKKISSSPNDHNFVDDYTYIVKDKYETLYSSMVVQIGYSPEFTHINQWQNQAQYIMDLNYICGFRFISISEEEAEFVLYFDKNVPEEHRNKFRYLFFQILKLMALNITEYEPVICECGNHLDRITISKLKLEGKNSAYCVICGHRINLFNSKQNEPEVRLSPKAQNIYDSMSLQNLYEEELTYIKRFKINRPSPRCHISYATENKEFAQKIIKDLQHAGIEILENTEEIQQKDFIIIIATNAYYNAIGTIFPILYTDSIFNCINKNRPHVKFLLFENKTTSNNHDFYFSEPSLYCVTLFDLVLSLYSIPLDHITFKSSREKLNDKRRFLQDGVKSKGETLKNTNTKNKKNFVFKDFEIFIANNNTIYVKTEKFGESQGEFNLDLNEFKSRLKRIEKRDTDIEFLKSIGIDLYNSIFTEKNDKLWYSTKRFARISKHGTRLRLIFENPELASLPWELLYDKDSNTFISTDISTLLTRYTKLEKIKQKIKFQETPIKILLIIATPKGLPRINVRCEKKIIQDALQTKIDTNKIILKTESKPTIDRLVSILREEDFNIIHFIGHTNFQNQTGGIALIDKDRKVDYINDENFSSLFIGRKSIQLIVMNSCLTAKSSIESFSGIANAMVKQGLPAVIGMQYPITNKTASIFAEHFYSSLVLDSPIDVALQEARHALSETFSGKPDFAYPVLFLREAN